NGRYADTSPVWSKDESQIYFTSNHVDEPYYEPPQTDIYSIDVKGGEPRKLVHVDGQAGGLSLSPDGKHLAYVSALRGQPERSYDQPDLFTTTLSNGAAAKNLTAGYDFDIAGAIGGDQAPPRGSVPSSPYWSSDGRYIFVSAGERGRSNLKRVDAESGKIE